MNVPRLKQSSAGVLLVDVQPAFLDAAFPEGGDALDSLMLRLEHLLMLADWFDLPIIATFETPISENGELPVNLEALFPASGYTFVKRFFGSMSETRIAEASDRTGVEQWLVAGTETDVCVLQTVLGLLDSGLEVFLLEDCLFTTESNPGPALQRMYEAGAVPATLKTAAYELVEKADEIPWYPEFWAPGFQPDKPFPASFVPPEEWPAWK